MRTLNAKRARFVLEYLVDHNATQAAIRAGYSPRSAKQQGQQLLTKLDVQAELQAKSGEIEERTEIKAEDVRRELGLVGFSDIGEILDFSQECVRLRPANEIPESARRAISSMKVRRYVEGKGKDAETVEVVEFKLWPKDSALEKLGKHLGMFKDDKPNGTPENPLHIVLKGADPKEL